jgi:hypothetical protein
MVGVVVAGYTDIIERGIEQPQGATPMTTSHSLKTMSHNTELTLEQLTQISGGSTREERKEKRKEKREKRREEREHKKTCPDGKRTPNCPYPVPEVTVSIDLN